jgi:cell division initiation protein
MSYTPVELRHVRVGRSLFGYNRAMVEQLIEEVAHSFEATWRERGELTEKVEALEKQLDEHRQRENLLTSTLLAAEQAASDVKEKARREADAIVQEAHSEARAIGRKAQAERERLMSETRRIESMLRSALGVVEDGIAEVGPEAGPAGEAQAATAPPVVVPVRAVPQVSPVEQPQSASPPAEHEPEAVARQDEKPSAPVLERIPGARSADFDWGE